MFGINTYNFCSGIQTSISGIQAYTGSRVGSKVPGFGSQVRIRHPRPGTLVPTLELQLSDPKHGTLNPKPEPHALNPHLSKTDTETGLGRQSASRRQTAADAKFTNRDQWSRWFFWLISGVFMTRFHDRQPLLDSRRARRTGSEGAQPGHDAKDALQSGSARVTIPERCGQQALSSSSPTFKPLSHPAEGEFPRDCGLEGVERTLRG